MSRVRFKTNNQGTILLFPCSLEDKIPQGSPSRLINTIVDDLDIDCLLKSYKGGGTSSYHPRSMLKVLFLGYLNNIYSCRKLEKQVKENIHYMWLSGGQEPDFRTINDFRSKRLKGHINGLFTQVVVLLSQMGYISLEKQYIDGTKIESVSNRYTFVWRKSVEKNKARLESKIQQILSQIEEGIYGDNTATEITPIPVDSEELKRRIASINKENRSKEEGKAIRDLEEKHLPKLQEYEAHLRIMGDKRNSYSKTDKEATFMRMKEDHMKNGQLKPAYNLQIGTENQFITNYAYYQDRDDTMTLPSFLELHRCRYGRHLKEVCADAGYGSEENYNCMESNMIDAYVKFSYFHREQKRSFKDNPFLQDNLYYNSQADYFVCPMGQQMSQIGTKKAQTKSGYHTTLTLYQAHNCNGCPLRGSCHQAKENRIISVNHTLRGYKQKIREMLTSEKGLEHRSKRPVEVEAVFGQLKYNKQYNRLRHRGIDKINMDFGILAIAFNIGKLFNKRAKAASFDFFNHHETLFTTYIFLLKQFLLTRQPKNAPKLKYRKIYNAAA